MTLTLESRGYAVLGRVTHRVDLVDETEYAYIGPSLDTHSQPLAWPKAIWHCLCREEQDESVPEAG